MRIDNSQNVAIVIVCGITQNTVLGPVFFYMYVNGIFLIVSSGHIISFADDPPVPYSEKTWTEMNERLKKDVEMVRP